MGQNGQIVFYTCERPDDPEGLVLTLVRIFEPRCIRVVARSIGEDREWQRFLDDRESTPLEILADADDAEAFVSYYREGCWLSGEMIGSPLGQKVRESIDRSIPVSVRGHFLPGDLILRIGHHDLFECAEHDCGHLVARPFLAVSFFGYSTPRDWSGFRHRVFAITEIQEIHKRLEEVIGPLERCVLWET